MQRASLPTFPWLTTTRKRRHSTSFPPLSKRCFRPFLPRFGNALTSGGLGGGKKKANLPHEGTHRGVDLGLRPHAAATRLSYSARGFVSDCVVGLYSVMKSQILFARFSDRERPASKSEMRFASPSVKIGRSSCRERVCQYV